MDVGARKRLHDESVGEWGNQGYNGTRLSEGDRMSMHATLGIRFADNTISGCYVHMDGSTMENRIRLFVDQYTTTGLAVLISEAQSKGGMRSFYIPNVTIPEDPAARETEMLDDDRGNRSKKDVLILVSRASLLVT